MLITVAIARLILVPAAITLEPANTVDGAEGGGPLDDGDGDGDDARARARARRLKLPPPLGLPLLPASRVIDHPPPPSPPPLLLLCPCSCSHSSLLPAVGVPAVPAVPARWWLPPDPRPVDTLRRVAGWCRRGGGRLSVLWALPLCRVPLCREPSGPPLAARPAAPARRVRVRVRGCPRKPAAHHIKGGDNAGASSGYLSRCWRNSCGGAPAGLGRGLAAAARPSQCCWWPPCGVLIRRRLSCSTRIVSDMLAPSTPRPSSSSAAGVSLARRRSPISASRSVNRAVLLDW